MGTWSTAQLSSWKREASLDDEDTERLQSALTSDFSLRSITREKRLQDNIGRTIRRITSVPSGADQAMVTLTFDADETLQLWLYPRKQ